MSNFFLRNPDCVFIHIPKTGGTTIRKGVWKSNVEGPVFGSIPPEWLGMRFAFVRHPLQRLISAWRMFTVGAAGDSQWTLPKDARNLSIQEFFDIVSNEEIIFDQRRKSFEEKIRHHTIPQTHPFNCLTLAEFVGRYECFESDLRQILGKVGLSDFDVPVMHTTPKTPWDSVLKGDLLCRCIEYYREDFSQLGYPIPAMR